MMGDELGPAIMKAAVDGIWPFRPKSVELFTDFDIEFFQDRILASMRFPNSSMEFYGVVTLGHNDLVECPAAVLLVAETMYYAVRNRDSKEPGEHVVLGEE